MANTQIHEVIRALCMFFNLITLFPDIFSFDTQCSITQKQKIAHDVYHTQQNQIENAKNLIKRTRSVHCVTRGTQCKTEHNGPPYLWNPKRSVWHCHRAACLSELLRAEQPRTQCERAAP